MSLPPTMTVADLQRTLSRITDRSPSAAERPVYLVIEPADDDDMNAETIYAPVTHGTAVRDRLWWQDEPEIMVQLLGTTPKGNDG